MNNDESYISSCSTSSLSPYELIDHDLETYSFKGDEGLQRAQELLTRIEAFWENSISSLTNDLIEKYWELKPKLFSKVAIAQKGNVSIYALYLKILDEKQKLDQRLQNIEEQINELQIKKSNPQFIINQILFHNGPVSGFPVTVFEDSPEITQLRKEKLLIKERLRVVDTNYNNFCAPIMEKVCDLVETEQQSQGFLYRIINQNNRVSYLVGTIHEATNDMAKSSILHYAIEHSDRLILEMGSPLSRVLYQMRKLNVMNPYKNSIDLTLHTAAAHKGIPIEALETLSDQYAALAADLLPSDFHFHEFAWNTLKYSAGSIGNWYTNSFETVKTGSFIEQITNFSSYILTPFVRAAKAPYAASKWIVKKSFNLTDHYFTRKTEKGPLSQRMQIALMNDMWQSGSNLFSTTSKAIIDNRNIKWLNGTAEQQGMIERLQTTEESLCYAFGFGHLFLGEPSILSALQKQGNLIIERGYYDFETNNIVWSEE